MRQAQIHDDQIQLVKVSVHLRQQLGHALRHDGAMAAGIERGQSVADCIRISL